MSLFIKRKRTSLKEEALFSIQALLEGKQNEWSRFVRSTLGLVRGLIHKNLHRNGLFLGNDQIEDVIQDVYLKITKNNYKVLAAYDSERSELSTWLSVLCFSSTMDYLRKNIRHQAAELSQEKIESYDAQTYKDNDQALFGDHTFEKDGLWAKIPQGLLSPQQHHFLDLYYKQEEDVPKIAQKMGIKEQSVRSLKHKTILKLRSHFAQEAVL